MLTFPGALDRDVTTALRAAGFRFNKVFQHWEGLARPDEAETLAKAHGGALRRTVADNSTAQQTVTAEAAE